MRKQALREYKGKWIKWPMTIRSENYSIEQSS